MVRLLGMYLLIPELTVCLRREEGPGNEVNHYIYTSFKIFSLSCNRAFRLISASPSTIVIIRPSNCVSRSNKTWRQYVSPVTTSHYV